VSKQKKIRQKPRVLGILLQAASVIFSWFPLIKQNYHPRVDCHPSPLNQKWGISTLVYDKYKGSTGCKSEKIPAGPGMEPGKIGRKGRTSTQYIGTLEIKGKFPSSEMVHKLVAALGVIPRNCFPKTCIRTSP